MQLALPPARERFQSESESDEVELPVLYELNEDKSAFFFAGFFLGCSALLLSPFDSSFEVEPFGLPLGFGVGFVAGTAPGASAWSAPSASATLAFFETEEGSDMDLFPEGGLEGPGASPSGAFGGSLASP